MLNNILILINPYYEPQIIEKHLAILIEHGKVAFGKVRSKVNENTPHPEENELKKLYLETNGENYMQLFITDYSSIYGLKVTNVVDKIEDIYIPEYYKELN